MVYQLDSPAKMSIVKKTVATGKVIPRREIEVKAQVSGVVEKLYVVGGPDREEGRDHRAHLAASQHAQCQRGGVAVAVGASINLQNQASDIERYQKLLAQGVISQSQFNTVRNQLRPAEGGGGVRGEHAGAADDRRHARAWCPT